MTVRTVVYILWGLLAVYWFVGAFSAKRASGRRAATPPGLLLLVAFVLLRLVRPGTLAVHSTIVQVVGVVLVACGLGLAAWARFYLGRNWGMPMTEKSEPELVTSGPYRFVRHPIYSGLLLGVIGTALATNLFWLIALALIGAYFIYSATVEERVMAKSFPEAYAAYKARTKMLIPFVL